MTTSQHTAAARARSRRGISTLEVLVGGALALVVVGAMYAFLTAQQRAFAANAAYTESQGATRTVSDLLSRELRMASYNPAGGAIAASGPCCPGWSQGIVEARRDLVHFRQDLNGDGVISAAGEDLTYTQVGHQIQRTDGAAAAQVLVDNVPTNGLVLRYYDAATVPNELVPGGTPAALTSCQRDCVTKVRIEIHAEHDSTAAHTVGLESGATTEVAIRNRSLTNF